MLDLSGDDHAACPFSQAIVFLSILFACYTMRAVTKLNNKKALGLFRHIHKPTMATNTNLSNADICVKQPTCCGHVQR